MPDPLSAQIKTLARKFDFLDLGFSLLDTPLTLPFYEHWLSQGREGDMKYLRQHLEAKSEPKEFFKPAQSAIVVLKSYEPHPYPARNPPIKKLRIARYAQGKDYHLEFSRELKSFVQNLASAFPNEQFRSMTDSQPLLERDLAHRAGLAWFGKNTCLIHPKKGSFFFIGEILTSLKIHGSASALPSQCGSCSLCIEACPTGALTAPLSLQPNRCISYITIESRTPPDPTTASKMGDHFFGCDTCQDVCPWNKVTPSPEKPTRSELISELQWILESSNNKLSRELSESPLLRATPRGLKKNALILIANLKLKELTATVTAILDQKDQLQDLASLCLKSLEAP